MRCHYAQFSEKNEVSIINIIINIIITIIIIIIITKIYIAHMPDGKINRQIKSEANKKLDLTKV